MIALPCWPLVRDASDVIVESDEGSALASRLKVDRYLQSSVAISSYGRFSDRKLSDDRSGLECVFSFQSFKLTLPVHHSLVYRRPSSNPQTLLNRPFSEISSKSTCASENSEELSSKLPEGNGNRRRSARNPPRLLVLVIGAKFCRRPD